MKKLFSIPLLFTVLALFSCAQEYTISGTIDGAVDGDSVVLGYSVDGEEFTVTDRTVIENGEFHFDGKVNGSKIYYIGYEQSPEPMYLLFFLEGGDIGIRMSGEESRVTGTPSNELNAEVEATIMDYVTQLLGAEVILESDDDTVSDSLRVALHQKLYDTQRDVSQYIRSTVFRNKKSIVSLYMMVQYIDLFGVEEIEQYVSEVPAENIDRNNNCLYDVLVEALNDRKNNPGELPLLDFE